eukprot:TRINITY_DN64211_c1_g1_i1.p1 TRINITY_DN64211_c1_g1~~TRINITY_DN64211_c1_g1_i1.p1  ORF type:complete len:705 (-),score=88.51 TRINITY_DN64211_c1_g1_i1:79-2157(-)
MDTRVILWLGHHDQLQQVERAGLAAAFRSALAHDNIDIHLVASSAEDLSDEAIRKTVPGAKQGEVDTNPVALKERKTRDIHVLPPLGIKVTTDADIKISCSQELQTYRVTAPADLLQLLTQKHLGCVGEISEFHPVTLEGPLRDIAGIPPNAVDYAFVYPLVGSMRGKRETGLDPGNTAHSVLSLGGFLYRDNDKRPLQLNALCQQTSETSHALFFGKKIKLSQEAENELHAKALLKPVALSSLNVTGFAAFKWVSPAEIKNWRQNPTADAQPGGGFVIKTQTQTVLFPVEIETAAMLKMIRMLMNKELRQYAESLEAEAHQPPPAPGGGGAAQSGHSPPQKKKSSKDKTASWSALLRSIARHSSSNLSTPKTLEDLKATTESQTHKKYKFNKNLGKGGFGSVQEIQHVHTGKLFACKHVNINKEVELMDDYLWDLQVKLQLMECTIGNMIRHPNIVHIEEWYMAPTEKPGRLGDLCIVMELCQGGSLAGIVQNTKANLPTEQDKFDEQQIWKWAAQISNALTALHAEKTIHRDIKLENLVLSCEDEHCKVEDMTVKICDFGSALDMNDRDPQTIDKVFTAPYMPPEVDSKFKKLDPPYTCAVDIFSFGCALLELCLHCRQNPHSQLHWARHDEDAEKLYSEKIQERGYSFTLASLITSMLNCDPTKRPVAAFVLEEAERFLLKGSFAEAQP